jgi:hypothetical protein
MTGKNSPASAKPAARQAAKEREDRKKGYCLKPDFADSSRLRLADRFSQINGPFLCSLRSFAAILLLRLLNELERLRPDAVLQIEWMMRGAALVLEQAFERCGFRDQ